MAPRKSKKNLSEGTLVPRWKHTKRTPYDAATLQGECDHRPRVYLTQPPCRAFILKPSVPESPCGNQSGRNIGSRTNTIYGSCHPAFCTRTLDGNTSIPAKTCRQTPWWNVQYRARRPKRTYINFRGCRWHVPAFFAENLLNPSFFWF